jgi:hypothetical protein
MTRAARIAHSLGGALAVAGALAFAADARAEDPNQKTGTTIADPKGTPVSFTSSRIDTVIYIAKGDGPAAADPTPFERLGAAPLTVKLAPGTYTIETESESTSTGRERIRVDQTPINIEIRPGDETVKTMGAMFEGLGVISMLTGIVVAVAVSPHDDKFPRWEIAIPTLVGGAGLFGLGVGLSAIGSTDIHLPRASVQGVSASFTVTF